MPNWVWNKLYVSGPAQDITEFRVRNRDSYYPVAPIVSLPKKVKVAWVAAGSFQKDRSKRPRSKENKVKRVVVDLSFDKMIPIPLAVTRKPLIKMRFNSYDDPVLRWCIKRWGCKWDAYVSKLERKSANRLFYRFSTPWDPPLQWLRYVSRKYPKLRFSLHYHDQAPWVIVRGINGCLM